MSKKLKPKKAFKKNLWSDFQISDSKCLRFIAGLGAKLLRPPRQQSLRVWSDENRILPADSARPGRWQTGWAPCAPGVYDAFSDPLTKEIIVCCSTQLMKTELLINILLYLIQVEPAPMMVLQPDVKLANKFSADRVGKSAREMEFHQPFLAPTSSVGKRANGTKDNRPFPGGFLLIRSSAEKSSLISDSLKYVLCDEVNKFIKDVTGDIKSRQTMFPDSKTVIVSSVGPVGECRITNEYERGDMNEWHVCCPECGVAQLPVFERVRWPKSKPDEAVYICEHCEARLTNGKMKEANRNGYWIPKTEVVDGVRSFKVNSFAHPTLSISDLAREYIAATAYYEKNGIDDKLRVFWTDRMSVNYENATGAINPNKLKKAFCTTYPLGDRDIPNAVQLITIAVDVQSDRLEVEAVGWGYRVVVGSDGKTYNRGVRYGLEYFKIMGDTGTMKPYQILERYFDKTVWRREDGLRFYAWVMGIDSGGNHTDTVIKFTSFKGKKRIFPLKGASHRDAALIRTSDKKDVLDRYKNELFLVGTYDAKDYIFASLRGSSTGDKKDSDWFYPLRPDRGYTESYFAGLTSEKMIMQPKKNAKAVRLYVPTGKARNEPLDLAVYNLALLRSVGEDDLVRREKKHNKIVAQRKSKKQELKKKNGKL